MSSATQVQTASSHLHRFSKTWLPDDLNSGFITYYNSLARLGFTTRDDEAGTLSLISHSEAGQILANRWQSKWMASPEAISAADYISSTAPVTSLERSILQSVGYQDLFDIPAKGLVVGRALIAFLQQRLDQELKREEQQRLLNASSAQSTAKAKDKSKGKGAKKRGRPRKAEQVPQVHGRRQLEQAYGRIGLSTSEKAVARKLLSALRNHYIKTLPEPQGKIIKRNSLGSRSTVARAFKKLRDGGLITETHRIANNNMGNASSGITNLGPAFFDLKRLTQPQSEGPKLNPRSAIFDPTKPVAMTEVNSEIWTRALEPSKEGPMEVAPRASASLRAAALEPTSKDETKTNQAQQQIAETKQGTDCVEPVVKRINGMSNPLNVQLDDVVWHGKDKLVVKYGYRWESNEYGLLNVDTGESLWLSATVLRVAD